MTKAQPRQIKDNMSCHLELHLKRRLISVLCELSKVRGYYRVLKLQCSVFDEFFPSSSKQMHTWDFLNCLSAHSSEPL